MGKVRLKITPSLTCILDAQNSDWLILDREIGEKTTIGDMLRDFSSAHTDFHKMVFNPATGKISDEIYVVLNDNLLQFPDVTETEVKDGDIVTLVPVYAGG